MNINWKIRLMNKQFWLAFVPAVLLLVQTILVPFGYQWDFGALSQELSAIINAAFAVLTILGVVTDHTTPGISDSPRALNYARPGEFTEE